MFEIEKFDKKAYDIAFNKNNYKRFELKINKEKEKELINHLEKQENVNKYIKSLILKDMQN